MSEWKSSCNRPSFTHVSVHQTLVGKALYEHAKSCATIAAVASASYRFMLSSLGPNLVALIDIEKDTIDLVDKIFIKFNHNNMQLTPALHIAFYNKDRMLSLVNKLKGSYNDSNSSNNAAHHQIQSVGNSADDDDDCNTNSNSNNTQHYFSSSLRKLRLGRHDAGYLPEFSCFTALSSLRIDLLKNAYKKVISA